MMAFYELEDLNDISAAGGIAAGIGMFYDFIGVPDEVMELLTAIAPVNDGASLFLEDLRPVEERERTVVLVHEVDMATVRRFHDWGFQIWTPVIMAREDGGTVWQGFVDLTDLC